MENFVDQEITLNVMPGFAAAFQAAEPKRINLTVSSQLTENYSTGKAIAGANVADLTAVQDERGRPMIFWRSVTGRLIVTLDDEATATGRAEYDLTPAPDRPLTVRRFGVGQSLNGDIYLAAAMEDPARPGESHLFITGAIANSPKASDWGAFASRWRARGSRPATTVTRVLVGNKPVARGGPMIVVVTEESGQAFHYDIDSDIRREVKEWRRLSLPRNIEKVLDIAIGANEDGPGVYVLEESRGALALSFVPQEKNADRVSLPVPPNPSRRGGALSVLPGNAAGHTDLYIAGDGLYLIPVELQSSATRLEEITTIAPPARLKGLKNLIVREDEQNISIWALDEDSHLHYVSGKKPAVADAAAGDDRTAAWGAAVPLRKQTRMVATFRNRLKQSNDLIALADDNSLSHLLQSPENSIWTEKDIPVNDDEKMQSFTCYATTINVAVEDQKGQPVALGLGQEFDGGGDKLQTFELTSSEWTEVIINGVTYELDRNNPVAVRPDGQGCITILNKVSGIASPIFYLSNQATGLDRQPVDPAHKTRQSLERVDAEALRNTRLADGSSLLPAGLGDKEVADAGKALAELVRVNKEVPQDGSSSKNYVKDGALTGPADGAETVIVRWGLSSDGESLQYREGDDALMSFHRQMAAIDPDLARLDADHLTAQGVLSGILWELAGNVLEWMKNTAAKVFDVIVTEVKKAAEHFYAIVVKIGETAYQFAVDCLSHVAHAIDWVLQKALKIDFKKITDWLGFLFSWDDIVATHNVMVNVINQMIDRGKSEIEGVEKKVEVFFDGLIEQVKTVKPVAVAAADSGVGAQLETAKSSGSAADQANMKKGLSFYDSPAGNFAGYHLQHSIKPPKGGLLLAAGPDAEVEGVVAELRELWESIQGSMINFGKSLHTVFVEGRLTVNEAVRLLTADAAIGFLNVFKQMVVKFLRLARKLVTMAQDAMNHKLDIPFLSSLYKKYVGTDMTLLDGLVLLLSVPVTTLYKLLRGEAPFPFVGVKLTAEGAAEAAADDGLSTHPMYEGKSKKPRTHGLDTLIGVGLWTALAIGSAAAGYAIFKLLYHVSSLFRSLADRTSTAVKQLQAAFPKVLVFFSGVAAVLGLFGWLTKGFWMVFTARDYFKVPADFILVGRWAVSGLGVAAEMGGIADPSATLVAIARMIQSQLDHWLILPYAIAKIVEHAKGPDQWLIAMDAVNFLSTTAGHLGTVCSSASSLIPETAEPVTLAAKGTLWTVGFALGALNGVVSTGATVVPIVLDKVLP